MALPFAFDISALIWRSLFCLGTGISVLSGAPIAYSFFVSGQSDQKLRRKIAWLIGITASLAFIVALGVSIALPEPRSSGITRQDLEAAVSQPPRLVIRQITPVWLAKDDLRFNVNYSNDGQRGVRGTIAHFGIAIAGDQILKPDLDKIFLGFRNLKQPDPKSTDSIQPGEVRTATLPGELETHTDLTEEKFREIQTKKQSLYLFVVIMFFDQDTNNAWQTELCQYWDYRVPPELVQRILPHLCTSHNGVFRVEAPK
jgi:hypothetical protein